jgi:hypothetical protein
VSALAAAATRIVRGLAPGIPIENVRTVAQIKDQSVAPRRLNAVLVWSFGLLALIIAAVGIAGVLDSGGSRVTGGPGRHHASAVTRGGRHATVIVTSTLPRVAWE